MKVLSEPPASRDGEGAPWPSRRAAPSGGAAERWLPALLRALALGGATFPLQACSSVCEHQQIARSATTEAVARQHPEVVAELWGVANPQEASQPVPRATCSRVCGEAVVSCSLEVPATGSPGEPTLLCVFGSQETCHLRGPSLGLGGNGCVYGCGRLPDRTVARLRRRLPDPLAQFVAEVAQLEALSVVAFAQLGSDLARHGAPRELRRRVSLARRDERRHASLARALLARLGARAERPPKVGPRRRSLETVARNNAVDGCVRETFGALLGCLQAARAEDPLLRAFFQAIAEDELSHAALSWDVHRALSARLSAAARVRVARAQRAALVALERHSVDVPPSLQRRAGAPAALERRALARAFGAALPFDGATDHELDGGATPAAAGVGG